MILSLTSVDSFVQPEIQGLKASLKAYSGGREKNKNKNYFPHDDISVNLSSKLNAE